MNASKYDINEMSPEELRTAYVEQYAHTFECDRQHAEEMFLAEYSADHDFHTLANVEYAIQEVLRICG